MTLDTLHTSAMLFLSIVFESAPFILLGALFSSLVLVFIPADFFRKKLPRNPVLSLPPALALSAVFPVCECAIIPVVRGLVRKGMPISAGTVFLVAAPILNPVVLASTFYAFRFNLDVVVLRFVLAAAAALIVGFIVYLALESGGRRPFAKDIPMAGETHSRPSFFSPGTWKRVLDHTIDEFFTIGKYFILGAGVASLFQTYMSQQAVMAFTESAFIAPMVMMLLGYVLSLCSTADAFVAASFAGTFTPMSIVAFLVFGPMLDIKNTAMLLGYFPLRFVILFIAAAAATVYTLVVTMQFLL